MLDEYIFSYTGPAVEREEELIGKCARSCVCVLH